MLGGSGAQIGNDTLSVAWLRRGYRHVDAASWLLLVDTKGGHDAAYTLPPTFFCAATRARASHEKKLACTLRLLLVRFGDHFKTCCVSISDP